MDNFTIKILVVDDELSICELMKINLELAGYSVDMAHSAESALKMPLSQYSLLVFDIMMGDMSGLELVSRVRLKLPTSRLSYVRLSRRRLRSSTVLPVVLTTISKNLFPCVSLCSVYRAC